MFVKNITKLTMITTLASLFVPKKKLKFNFTCFMYVCPISIKRVSKKSFTFDIRLIRPKIAHQREYPFSVFHFTRLISKNCFLRYRNFGWVTVALTGIEHVSQWFTLFKLESRPDKFVWQKSDALYMFD